MKAILTGFAAFALVLAVQPRAPGQPHPRQATAEQIEAAVAHAEAQTVTH